MSLRFIKPSLLALAFAGLTMAGEIPIPRKRPVSVFDLELKVESAIPVIENKRGAKQRNYRPKRGVDSVVRIVGQRRGMYIIEIYEDGVKRGGKYLISEKWAERILEVDSVLKVAQMNEMVKDAGVAIQGADCPVPEAEVEPLQELPSEPVRPAKTLMYDGSIEKILTDSGEMVQCRKGVSIDSELSENLYIALARLRSITDCGEPIRTIRSKLESKALFPINPISSCNVELNFLTRDQKAGKLTVTLESGKEVELNWQSEGPRSVEEWLGGENGFLNDPAFAEICPAAVLAGSEDKLYQVSLMDSTGRELAPKGARVIAEAEQAPTTRGARVVSAEVEAAAEPALTMIADEAPEPQGESVTLPESVPIPVPRPENLEALTNIPIPEPRPTDLAIPKAMEDRAVASSVRSECDVAGVSASWKQNCEKLFNSDIPKDALRYALDVMKLNDDSFESDRCYKTANSGHYSMRGVTKNAFANKMSDGLPNKCQFVINDTRDKLGAFRGRMYYVDLCNGNAPKITKTYFNMGTGTFKNNYADSGGAHTTVKGAFFTNYKTFSFQKDNAAYRSVKSRVRSLSGTYKAPSVQLFGLSTTNNEAGPNLKYMHVSGYKSSWGCPSIAPENYWMIEKLASSGPSLVLNYGHNMEDIRKCSR